MSATSLRKLLEEGRIWFAEPTINTASASTSQASPAYTQSPSRLAGIEKFLSLSNQFRPQATKRIVKFNLAPLDQSLPWGGLACGGVHEFFAPAGTQGPAASLPPLTLPTVIAGQAFSQLQAQMQNNSLPSYIIWIGRRSWPTPFLLKAIEQQTPKSFSLLSFCIFADPPTEKLHLWAIETALRTAGISIIIAACEKLSFSISRRFALAAEKGNSLGILLRAAKNLSLYRHTSNAAVKQNTPLNMPPTAALTSWLISPFPALSPFPCWEMRLLRCKGRQPYNNQWVIELQDEAALSLHILPAVGRKSKPASTAVANG